MNSCTKVPAANSNEFQVKKGITTSPVSTNIIKKRIANQIP
jgi:hypothetical protein